MRDAVSVEKLTRSERGGIVAASEDVQAFVPTGKQEGAAADKRWHPLFADGRTNHQQVPQLPGIEAHNFTVHHGTCIRQRRPAREHSNVARKTARTVGGNLNFTLTGAVEYPDSTAQYDAAIERVIARPKDGLTGHFALGTPTSRGSSQLRRI